MLKKHTFFIILFSLEFFFFSNCECAFSLAPNTSLPEIAKVLTDENSPQLNTEATDSEAEEENTQSQTDENAPETENPQSQTDENDPEAENTQSQPSENTPAKPRLSTRQTFIRTLRKTTTRKQLLNNLKERIERLRITEAREDSSEISDQESSFEESASIGIFSKYFLSEKYKDDKQLFSDWAKISEKNLKVLHIKGKPSSNNKNVLDKLLPNPSKKRLPKKIRNDISITYNRKIADNDLQKKYYLLTPFFNKRNVSRKNIVIYSPQKDLSKKEQFFSQDNYIKKLFEFLHEIYKDQPTDTFISIMNESSNVRLGKIALTFYLLIDHFEKQDTTLPIDPENFFFSFFKKLPDRELYSKEEIETLMKLFIYRLEFQEKEFSTKTPEEFDKELSFFKRNKLPIILLSISYGLFALFFTAFFVLTYFFPDASLFITLTIVLFTIVTFLLPTLFLLLQLWYWLKEKHPKPYLALLTILCLTFFLLGLLSFKSILLSHQIGIAFLLLAFVVGIHGIFRIPYVRNKFVKSLKDMIKKGKIADEETLKKILIKHSLTKKNGNFTNYGLEMKGFVNEARNIFSRNKANTEMLIQRFKKKFTSQDNTESSANQEKDDFLDKETFLALLYQNGVYTSPECRSYTEFGLTFKETIEELLSQRAPTFAFKLKAFIGKNLMNKDKKALKAIEKELSKKYPDDQTPPLCNVITNKDRPFSILLNKRPSDSNLLLNSVYTDTLWNKEKKNTTQKNLKKIYYDFIMINNKKLGLFQNKSLVDEAVIADVILEFLKKNSEDVEKHLDMLKSFFEKVLKKDFPQKHMNIEKFLNHLKDENDHLTEFLNNFSSESENKLYEDILTNIQDSPSEKRTAFDHLLTHIKSFSQSA